MSLETMKELVKELERINDHIEAKTAEMKEELHRYYIDFGYIPSNKKENNEKE